MLKRQHNAFNYNRRLIEEGPTPTVLNVDGEVNYKYAILSGTFKADAEGIQYL